MSTIIGGRYQLVRELGAGGMGRVYAAVDIQSGRSVAAKVMLAHGEDSLAALLRFYQEGAVLATLKHPNIVEVYGTFMEAETCCIVMELLEGRSLGTILRFERLGMSRVQGIVRQVASALSYAHGRGIVHRDIKPDNIMVIGNDRVKVTDFGIARVLRPGSTLNTLTKSGMSLGTPLYMSPEQIEGRPVDGRSDIYSLGTVLFQMVTGRPPFEGDDALTIAFQHVHKAPPRPRDLNGEVTEPWETIILTALAKDPTDRFQTAAQFEEAITAMRPSVQDRSSSVGIDETRIRTADRGNTSHADLASNPSPSTSTPRDVAISVPRYTQPRDRGDTEETPRPPSGIRMPWWVAAVLVIVALSGVGTAVALSRSRATPSAAHPSPTGLFVIHPSATQVPKILRSTPRPPTARPVPTTHPTPANLPASPTVAASPLPVATTYTPGHDEMTAIRQELTDYRVAQQAAYGPDHDYTLLNTAVTGIAQRAILCIARDKPNSLVSTRTYLTETIVASSVQSITFTTSGTGAQAVVDRHDILTTHASDGSVSSQDETYTVTYTLVSEGNNWKVSDYSFTAPDGSSGTAADDARPCTG